MSSLKKFMEDKLKLKLNKEKSKTAKSDKVKFLWITIIDGAIAISKVAFDRAMEKVKQLIPRGSHVPIEKAFDKVAQWFKVWASYFKMTQFPF